jgi:hypothetical protein
MKEEPSVAEQNSDTKPAENENLDNQTAVSGVDNPNNVPYARFNEVVKSNKDMTKKLQDLMSSKEADRVKTMEEQGQYKELNTELQSKIDTLTEKNNYYVEQERIERDNLLSKLPEDDRKIYGDLSTNKLKTHIEKFSQKSNVQTDKSNAVRGNVLPDDKNIWDMSSEDKRKNWTAYLNKFKK